MASKKRKLSGLSGLELRLAYDRLVALQESFVFEDTDQSASDSDLKQTFEEQIGATVQLLLSKLEGDQSFSFSSASYESLRSLKVEFAGDLELHQEYKDKVIISTESGSDRTWSAKLFHDHLHMLQTKVARSNEACARAWVDAFMFRAAAIVPDNRFVVLNLEHRINYIRVSPNTLTKIGGLIDYTALVETNQSSASRYINRPILTKLKKPPHGLVIVEAKFELLSDHIPQAICEMYACAKELGINIIRGAITSGFRWIFLHLTLNDDGGGQYYESETFLFPSYFNIDGSVSMKVEAADLIAAIIASWMERGLSPIGDDEYLVPSD